MLQVAIVDSQDFYSVHFYLFSVVCDGRQDGTQRLKAHSHVQEVSGEEEIIVMAENWEQHVPGEIEERLSKKKNK